MDAPGGEFHTFDNQLLVPHNSRWHNRMLLSSHLIFLSYSNVSALRQFKDTGCCALKFTVDRVEFSRPTHLQCNSRGGSLFTCLFRIHTPFNQSTISCSYIIYRLQSTNSNKRQLCIQLFRTNHRHCTQFLPKSPLKTCRCYRRVRSTLYLL